MSRLYFTGCNIIAQNKQLQNVILLVKTKLSSFKPNYILRNKPVTIGIC